MKPSLSAIKRIEIEAQKIGGVVSLAQGLPGLASDNVIREAACNAIQNGDADRYSFSRGIPELRNELSNFLQKQRLAYNPDTEIMVTAGAIEALSSIALSLLEPGDEAITFTPTYYANYRNIVSVSRGILKSVPFDEANNWRINFSKLEKTISSKTKLLILCNPNNPTGSVIPQEDLMKLGECALQHNFTIVFDDVYHDIYFGEKPYALYEEKRLRNNILRIVSFSKVFSLCGWRIAFIHGPEQLVEKITPTHDVLINCAPVVSQYAVLGGLPHFERIAANARETYEKHRTFVLEELNTLSKYLDFSVPEGAYYIFPKLKNVPDDEAFCMDVLKKAKVALVPGSDFGPGGEGHVRICFGRKMEELEEGTKRLREYFR
ncbi:MAG: pyridoxal phosphate-dependent aminotransferase [Candidatus Roizmanbacteria bacterium]|nr:pyridoxal phosphate-dependent aminotransferase [Candidatus Roizmanbacteria bacterium]